MPAQRITRESVALAIAAAGPMSLTLQAFERLRSDILHGRLRPSERLRIQALSQHYNIGTSAIREALSRLVTDGLVECESPRGFCVAQASREDLVDLTRMRVEVECIALRGAIEHGGIEWESGLLSAFHRLSKTPPPTTVDLQARWATIHRQFHSALVAGRESRWNERLCRLLYDQSERYRNLAGHHTSQHSRDPVSEHWALMDAAMARNADKATRLLAEHFWATTEIILAAGYGETAESSDSG